jgi:predicted nucleic acid-binding protein
VILIDVNILLYAVNAASTQHASAREWLDRQLTGSVAVGMPWLVLTGFLRLAGH